jgi:hypothetical protein
MANLRLYNFGTKGVNVDASDLHMEDGELRQAQNAVHNIEGALGGIVNRQGMERFNASVTAGSVLGGIGVPLDDERGERHLFIGAHSFTES